ncbi:cyclic nucleotide-binding/CBS domain-containing protein [Natrinema versiforme]|uniref:CBS domain-containing protein n=1 Tax=Natrinema versiforme TaxID=88724 RepID=A0A4P8WQ53_9EURY|nr:CBS domain-containing protein [Natrinema versiforme]QCS44633.1 CBS domain-containing protein [Natrinema versiforme]
MIPFYIGEVMRKRAAELEKDRKASRAVEKLTEPDAELVVVTEDGDPVGVFTHSEVVTLVDDETDVSTTTLAECSLSPVATVNESESIETAAAMMKKNGLRYLLVTKASEIIGYLTDRDISQAVADSEKESSK